MKVNVNAPMDTNQRSEHSGCSRIENSQLEKPQWPSLDFFELNLQLEITRQSCMTTWGNMNEDYR